MSGALRSRLGVLVVATVVASVVVVVLEGSAAWTASTFAVNTTADSHDAVAGDGVCSDAAGRCSLRAASEEATALAGMDTITIPAGTYAYTIPGRVYFTDDVSITGAGSAVTVVDGAGLDGVMGVGDGGVTAIAATLDGITLRNGASDDMGGGLVTVLGTVTLADVIISDNTWTGAGLGWLPIAGDFNLD
jgi:hypothetical protein